ncbi:hypothetical protein Hdeb2414_s0007g00236331 [Helianthus debilis subsp. tardiflorus]
MVKAVQEDGKPTWLDQIRHHFLHPTNESFATYANTVLGEDDVDDATDPTREEVIVLSSGGSDRYLEGLTSHFRRAGPAQGVEPANEPVVADVEVPIETAGQLETRRKTKADRSEGEEKRAEEKTTETPRKRPSTLPALDYIVVSDTLSGLGTGEKHHGSDPDDNATLTEMISEKKLLKIKSGSFTSRLLLCLHLRKANFKRRLLLHPRNLRLTWVFLVPRRVIFWRQYMLRPLLRVVVMAQVVLKVGIKVLKPRQSPVRPPNARPFIPGGDGGATSGVFRSPEFENVQGGSWDTHNPACDDLPHTPHWRLTQGSRMNNHENSQEFFSLSLPPAGRLFQKRRNRFELLDDHIHAGVNFFATSQEIVREWKLTGEETLEFENDKKFFAEKREKFNAEKKGLMWRVSDAE